MVLSEPLQGGYQKVTIPRLLHFVNLVFTLRLGIERNKKNLYIMRKFYLVGIVIFMTTMFSCGDDDKGLSITTGNLSGTWDLYKDVRILENGERIEIGFTCEEMKKRTKKPSSGNCEDSGKWSIFGARMQFTKNKIKILELYIKNNCAVCDKEKWVYKPYKSYDYEVSGNKIIYFNKSDLNSQNEEVEIISLTDNELKIKDSKGELHYRRK